MVLPSSWLTVIVRVHPVHAMNAEQRQTTADLWIKPTDLSHWPACRQLWNYIHHRPASILLLSPKADTHFAIPQRVEGWFDVDGWLHTHGRFTCLRAVTRPSSNRAQCRLTTKIEVNALTATLRRHQKCMLDSYCDSTHRPALVTIISVPRALNSSHNSLACRCASTDNRRCGELSISASALWWPLNLHPVVGWLNGEHWLLRLARSLLHPDE